MALHRPSASPASSTAPSVAKVTQPVERFWETITLAEMSPGQWESLCDGCAKCCLEKFEDKRTRQIEYTNVACRLLDLDSARCCDYANRSQRVPDCITLTISVLRDPYWLPETCAYRLLAEHKPLPQWHPLITGDPGSVINAGHCVLGRVVSEAEVKDLRWHLIDWIR